MKVYIFTKFKEYATTDEKISWSSAHRTREEAEAAMHDEIDSDIDLAMDPDDPVSEEEISRICAEGAERDPEAHDYVIAFSDYVAYYDVFETAM